MKNKYKLIGYLLSFLLTSCITTPQEEAADHTYKEAEIYPIQGTLLHGCISIHLERRSFPSNLYIIKCPDSNSITAHYQDGKINYDITVN